VFRTVAHITTPTPIAARLIRDKGVGREVEAISCGVDLARFHPRIATDRPAALRDIPDRLSVLFVGRLDEEKHLPELIDALSLVRHTAHTDVQLWLVGTGNQRAALQQRSQRRGVAEHVHFLGFVPDEELPAVYAEADVFCMPGVAELQSLATLEALASGKPIVAADAMALPHLVHAGINGYLYQPGDVDQLAYHLSTLLAHGHCARPWARPACAWSPSTTSTGPWRGSKPSTSRPTVGNGPRLHRRIQPPPT
jgi:glycosyltransferase involved in cell wall biosynthesis